MTALDIIRDEVEKDLMKWAFSKLPNANNVIDDHTVKVHGACTCVVHDHGVHYQKCGGGRRKLAHRGSE